MVRALAEEINRLVTDRLSDLLLVPDELSVQNLLKEGVEKNKISEMITIYNKIDLKGHESSYHNKKNYISALTGEGVADLKRILKNSLN